MPNPQLLAPLVGLLLLAGAATPGNALTFTWTGDGPGNFWNAQEGFPTFTTNWESGATTDQIPDSNDSVILNSSLTGSIFVDLITTRRVIEATLQGVSPVTLSGGILELSNGDLNATITSASHTVNSDVRMLSTGDWIINGGPGSLKVQGVVQGNFPLNKTGSGSLILSADNTYTGTTTVSSGTLSIGSGGTAGSIAGALVSDGTTIFNRSSSLTYGATISGSGTLRKQGAGSLTLTANNPFSGTTHIDTGTLHLGVGGTTGSLAGEIVNDGQLVVNRAGTAIMSNTISGSGNLTKLTSGMLILSGDNTYTGTTTVSQGVLRLGNGGVTGSLSGDINNQGQLEFNRSNDATYAGDISGSGTFRKIGGGVLTLSGNNTYTGTTTASNGTLRFASAGAIGTGDLLLTIGDVLFEDDAEFGFPLGEQPSFVQIGAISTFSTLSSNDTTLGPTGDVELQGGTLQTRRLHALAGSTIVGRGAIDAQFVGDLTSEVATTGDLDIGDPSAVNGFYSNGYLDVATGTTTLRDANTAVFDSAALITLGETGPATLAALNGLTLDFGANITGEGTVDTPDDPATPLVNNGAITGASPTELIEITGYVKGVGTCDNCLITGTEAPGFSPAAVNRGSITYRGALEIELGGASPGDEHDQLNHVLGSGMADLGGELEVSLINGFTPAAGQTFEIITAQSVVNTFDTESFPALGGGLELAIDYSASSVSIAVNGVPGDYNYDGAVDAADYTVWRDSEGLTGVGLAADGDSDGEIGDGDYAVWVAHFGQVAGAPPSLATPEPSSWVLFSACSLLGAALRRSE